MNPEYDVIVVGAGHAGIEAAAASARMGLKTLVVTLRLSEIGQMSCNPAVGGLAKGQLVREVDALGGLIGRMTDEAGIQFRMLNRSRGPAVQSPRAQADRKTYHSVACRVLGCMPNLTIIEDEVDDIGVAGSNISGVHCRRSGFIASKNVILTTGTFLNGIMHFGFQTGPGGRFGSPASCALSDSLRALGIGLGRLKTGTPPRLDGTTVDVSAFTAQYGDEPPPRFSFRGGVTPVNRAPCHLGYTNEMTHEIIRANLDRSPLYTGRITSRGPRYCPSIEDKVVRFAHHPRHYIFLEPEGLDTTEMYANGLPTSLPPEVQEQFVRSVRGLEHAVLTQFGYAVEYDYVLQHEISSTLESKKYCGLYFAGQINGTSGYEEAAALGLMAGINAAARMLNLPPFVLFRDEAYIGVLVDDLVTKTTDEPYRMFTSRAEHRLFLRQDNAHLRLWRYSKIYGLLPPDVIEQFSDEERQKDDIISELRKVRLPMTGDIKDIFMKHGMDVPQQSMTAADIIRSPNIRYEELFGVPGVPTPPATSIGSVTGSIIRQRITSQVETELKYQGYIERQREAVDRAQRHEKMMMPAQLDYDKVQSLTNEAREKLKKIKPITLGQAGRIAGISPADIQNILIYLASKGSIAGKA